MENNKDIVIAELKKQINNLEEHINAITLVNDHFVIRCDELQRENEELEEKLNEIINKKNT